MKTQPIYLLLFAILITSIAVGQPASSPFIERNYRTLNDKNNRAIAGFSGGGGTTLYFGLNNTDQVDECKTLSECHCA